MSVLGARWFASSWGSPHVPLALLPPVLAIGVTAGAGVLPKL